MTASSVRFLGVEELCYDTRKCNFDNLHDAQFVPCSSAEL